MSRYVLSSPIDRTAMPPTIAVATANNTQIHAVAPGGEVSASQWIP